MLSVKTKYSYRTDQIILEGKKFELERLRSFLLQEYPFLVQKHYVNAISQRTKFRRVSRTPTGALRIESDARPIHQTVFKYDWLAIFQDVARSPFILSQFLIHVHK
jgi:hypothetical protein